MGLGRGLLGLSLWACCACSLTSGFGDYTFGEADAAVPSGAGTEAGQPGGEGGIMSPPPGPDAGEPAGEGGGSGMTVGEAGQSGGSGTEAGGEPGGGSGTLAYCSQPGPDLCDGEDNDCDSSTADGSAEPSLDERCDGDDEDQCETGRIQCGAQGLFCSDDAAEDGREELDNAVDEDCDGTALYSALELKSSFPMPGQATSAADVSLVFALPNSLPLVGSLLQPDIQCRSALPQDIADAPWIQCADVAFDAGAGLVTVHPFGDVVSKLATFDGLRMSQVRAGRGTQWTLPASLTYYVHHSLHGEKHCEPEASDKAYFELARRLLVRATTPRFASSEVQLANPFIQVKFSPPLSARFSVGQGAGDLTLLSLRRRFTLDADEQLLLMVRTYESRRGQGCSAFTQHKHVFGTYDNKQRVNYNNLCAAVVVNREGAGLCLQHTPAGVVAVSHSRLSLFHTLAGSGEDPEVRYCTGKASTDTCADHMLWRKLVSSRGGKAGAEPLHLRFFSPKCHEGPDCASGEVLYLPGRGRFRDIFP